MDDKKYKIAFDLIVKAGNAKSSAMMALEAAREYDFEKAEEYLKEATEEMQQAHHAQFDLIQQESQGNPVDVNIILVHAQDHLTMAIKSIENVEEFINIYKLIEKLMKKEGK